MKLRNSLLATIFSASLAAGSALAADPITVEVDTSDAIGTIQPEVYGQFMEHLGAGIYGGLWVGEKSKIPNTDGIRDDVFAALKDLEPPVLRWPGGCFADYYDWRDGVGSAKKRPMRINVSWGGAPEPNTFGTHEFFNLAERLGAKTYLNFNLGTGTPKEAMDWMEYITFGGDSALANERRKNGRDEPWKIDYYSVGNETWGCGGNIGPENYAEQYAQFATFLRVVGADAPKRILSGSHEGNIQYSEAILSNPRARNLSDGISVHFYTLPTSDWSAKGDATGFPEEEWISTMIRTGKMDQIIQDQLAMIDEKSPNRELGLYVDEWGMWTEMEEGAALGSLYQQNTIRDAVVAAINLNIFHKYADRVPMTNIAQMVNVLQAMILTDGPDMILTPTYHVYHMYKPFMGATSLPVSFNGPDYTLGDQSYPSLSVSSAKAEDGTVYLAMVNVDPNEELEVKPMVGGNAVTSATGRRLTADALDAHNDFDNPDNVVPVDVSLSEAQGITFTLPPKSITVVAVNK